MKNKIGVKTTGLFLAAAFLGVSPSSANGWDAVFGLVFGERESSSAPAIEAVREVPAASPQPAAPVAIPALRSSEIVLGDFMGYARGRTYWMSGRTRLESADYRYFADMRVERRRVDLDLNHDSREVILLAAVPVYDRYVLDSRGQPSQVGRVCLSGTVLIQRGQFHSTYYTGAIAHAGGRGMIEVEPNDEIAEICLRNPY